MHTRGDWSRHFRRTFLALLVALTAVGGGTAQAQQTWTGAANTTWNNNGNWTPGPFPNANGAVAIFTNVGAGPVNITTTVSVGTLIFNNVGAGAYNITSDGGAFLGHPTTVAGALSNIVLLGNITGTQTINPAADAAGNLFANGTLTLTNVSAGTLVIGADATIASPGAVGVTVQGPGNVTIAGTLGGTGNNFMNLPLTMNGAGTLTVTGTNVGGATGTFRANTVANAGTINLDYTTNNTDKISSGNALALGGGLVRFLGNAGGSTQTTNGLTVSPGGSRLAVVENGGGAFTLTFGGVSRVAAGGTVDFTLPVAGAATITNANTNGILGGYATVGGTTWATGTGAAAPFTLAGLAAGGYSAAFAAGNNTDVGAGGPQAGITTNSLRFNAAGASTLTLAGTNTLQSGGILITPTAGAVTIDGGGTLTSGTVDVVVHQHSATAAVLNTAVVGTAGVTKSGPGALTLGGANTYTGTTTVNAGTLSFASAAALPAGPIGVNGGTFNVPAAAAVTVGSLNGGVAGTLALGATNLTVNQALVGTFAGTVSGTGGFTKAGTNTLTLTGAINTTGPVGVNGGSLALSGLLATIPSASAFNIANGSLVANNGAGNTPPTARFNPAAQVSLSGGTLSIISSGAAPPVSIIQPFAGATAALGDNRLNIQQSGGAPARIDLGALTRSNRATLVAAGTNLGQGTAQSNANAYITLPNAAGVALLSGGPAMNAANAAALNHGVIPWVVGDALGGSFATGSVMVSFNSDTNSLIALPVPNFASTVATAAGNNFRPIAAFTVPAGSPLSVNSFVSAATFTGTLDANLAIASGAMLNQSGTMTFAGASELVFGSTGTPAEAIITANGTINANTVVRAAALTKAGAGTLVLGANNAATLNGPVTINAGTISISADNQLGAAANAVTLANGATLQVTGTTPVTSARTINLAGLTGTINVTNTDAATGYTIAGSTVTGPGTLTKIGPGILTLPVANTHTGGTTITAGTVAVGNADSLGTGPASLGGGTLRFDAGTTLINPLAVTANSTINTNGNNATLNGVISGAAPTITKAGAGTLALGAANTFTGNLAVTAGGVTVGGLSGTIRTGTVSVANGATFTISNATADVLNRVTVPVTLTGGTLNFVGNAGADSATTLAALTAGAGSNTVNVTPGATRSATLTNTALTVTGSLLVSGQNLGLAVPVGTSFSRFFITGQAAGFLTGVTVNDGVGTGAGFYEPAVGLRRVQATDYMTGTVIQNSAPVNVPTTANFRVTPNQTISTGAAGENNTLASLTVAPGGAVTILAGTTLTLSSGNLTFETGTPAATIANGTLRAAGTTTLNVTADNTAGATISSVIAGSAVSKAGAGTLTLNGANTFTGALTVGGGVLNLGGTNATTAGVVVTGGTLNLTAAGALVAGNPVTVNTGGTFNLNDNALSVTTLAGTGGTINLGANAATVLTVTGGNQTTASAITGAGRLVYDNTAADTTLTLNGVSTYAGGTTVNRGSIATNNISGFGPGAITFTSTTSAPSVTYNLPADTTATIPNDFTFAFTGATQSRLFAAGATNTLTLSGRLSGTTTTLRFDSPAADTTTWRLTNAANDFTARVQVWEGALAITSNAALGNAANVLELGAASTTAGGLRFDANNIDIPREVNLSFASFVNPNGNTATFSGTLTGANALAVGGGGMLVLSNGANTQTGTVAVAANTELRVNGNLAATANAVTVNGTLSGNSAGNTINRNITVPSGGRLAPGAGAALGNLSVTTQTGAGEGVSLAAGSIYSFFVGNTIGTGGVALNSGGSSTGGPPATNHNTLTVGGVGTLAINAGTLFEINGNGALYAPNQQYSYLIATAVNDLSAVNITNQSQFLTGNFIGFAGGTFSVQGVGTNLFLNIRPVPEPATVLLLCAAGAGAWRVIRRRRHG